jgi:hypothetical protein
MPTLSNVLCFWPTAGLYQTMFFQCHQCETWTLDFSAYVSNLILICGSTCWQKLRLTLSYSYFNRCQFHHWWWWISTSYHEIAMINQWNTWLCRVDVGLHSVLILIELIFCLINKDERIMFESWYDTCVIHHSWSTINLNSDRSKCSSVHFSDLKGTHSSLYSLDLASLTYDSNQAFSIVKCHIMMTNLLVVGAVDFVRKWWIKLLQW